MMTPSGVGPVTTGDKLTAMQPARGVLARLVGGGFLAALWLTALGAGSSPHALTPAGSTVQDSDGDSDDTGLGPSPLYESLREAQLTHSGHIRDKRLRIDRFELTLTDGHLYVAPEIGGVVSAAVFLGDGVLRAYPPDAVEHHQLEKLSDEHQLDEAFDRLVLRFTDDTAARLESLAAPAPEQDTDRANRLLENRREDRFERQLDNPDSRVMEELLHRQAGALRPGRAYVLVDVDSSDHGWMTIEIEPNELEEVRLTRYDHRRRILDTWMSFDMLSDYGPAHRDAVLDGFAVDPESLEEADDDVTGVALGLPRRPIAPDREGWAERVDVPRAQVDLALEGDGDTQGTAALLIEPLEPTRGLRLRISQVLEITDARWRPDTSNDAPDTELLAVPEAGEASTEIGPDEPAALTGERIHFVQEQHDRLLEGDRFEPWVTVILPRTVAAGERFILELAYEGELVERLRQSKDFLLKDTLFWRPRHPDTRASRLDVTFRVPERYRVASAGTLTEERVDDDTRIMRWATSEPVRSMSFHYGRFDVTEAERDAPPSVSVYGNDNHLGFAPGNREKTVGDLTESIRLFTDYFGPFPFESLMVTETPTSSGQAFPGLLLLSYQAFGELHTGESELFRAHEVAHQWWGAAVDWEHYRDQWMTEGFANYAAAIYVLHGLEKPAQFEEMIDAWRLDVLGEGQVGQGLGLRHYGFNPTALRRSDGHDSGALVVGYRLNSTDTPFDYRVLVYEKGAYVLHMLRSMLLDQTTGDDERFRELMRTYATGHVRGIMSTRSFEAAVDRAFGEPMAWFFDQWVYGVEVPTYRPDLRVSPVSDSPSPFVLHGRIRQDDVSDGFKMPVPVRLTFDDRPPITRRIWVDAEEVQVELPLPARPTRVEFNYRHAVLAKVR
jgi:hypothetical protein